MNALFFFVMPIFGKVDDRLADSEKVKKKKNSRNRDTALLRCILWAWVGGCTKTKTKIPDKGKDNESHIEG